MDAASELTWTLHMDVRVSREAWTPVAALFTACFIRESLCLNATELKKGTRWRFLTFTTVLLAKKF